MRPTPLLFVTLAAATLLTTACENQEARRRAEIAATLDEVSATLTAATIGTVAPGTEAVAEREATLNRVVSSLSAARDAEGGQKAAMSLLAATAHREIASLALAEAALLENQLSRDRSVIATRLRAARRLMNVAETRSAVDLGQSEDHLSAKRSDAETLRRDSSERMADLDGPIGDLTDDNNHDRTEIDRLSAEANRLRREAAEFGGAEGFDRFEQAVVREREADQYEYRIAMREVDLNYELEPEHRLASVDFESAEEVIEAIDRSEENLRRYAEAAAEDADAIRQRARSFAAKITELLDAADARVDGDGDDASLASLYEKAITHLDSAASDARKAAGADRGDGAAPAKMAGARAQALRGRTFWARAQGLTDHLLLIDALIDAEELTGENTAALQARRDAIAAQRDEALESAATAYSEAESQIGQVGGRGNQDAFLAFTNSVKIARASLTGEEVDLPLQLGTGTSEPATTPPPADTTSGPATSHEQLIERLVAMDATDLTTAADTVTRASTAKGRAVLVGTTKFQAALMKQFGDQVAAMQAAGGGMGMGMGGAPTGFRDIRLESEDDDAAVYSFEGAGDQRTAMTVRRFDDGWYVEFESLLPDPQMIDMIAAQVPIFQDLAKRLDAGEFATMEEFSAAMMQAMMGAGGGAAPGGRRRPGVPGAPGR